MIRLAVAGALGRMGRCVLECASRDPSFTEPTGYVTSSDLTKHSSLPIGDREVSLYDTWIGPCDVLIDFTVADGTLAWLPICERERIPMVIGSTGHDATALTRIQEAAIRIPIVKDSNFSLGIAVLRNLLADTARQLGPAYDVEIIETHHRAKIDAPSGTALTLADEVVRATQPQSADHQPRIIHGRQGHTGPRPASQIAIHAVRMGDIVGQHEVHFSGSGETITLRHTAHSRETFALGALRAARWLLGRPPGLFDMPHVVSNS